MKGNPRRLEKPLGESQRCFCSLCSVCSSGRRRVQEAGYRNAPTADLIHRWAEIWRVTPHEWIQSLRVDMQQEVPEKIDRTSATRSTLEQQNFHRLMSPSAHQLTETSSISSTNRGGRWR